MLVIPSEARDLTIEVHDTHVTERDRLAFERFLAALAMTAA
jgi:hypothetical protein